MCGCAKSEKVTAVFAACAGVLLYVDVTGGYQQLLVLLLNVYHL